MKKRFSYYLVFMIPLLYISIADVFALPLSISLSSKSLFIVYMLTALLLSICGNYLERVSESKVLDMIATKRETVTGKVIVLRAGEEMEISIEEIAIGDFITIKAGQKIPADGVVIDGIGIMDESMLTGKSVPVEKSSGERVIGGSAVRSGTIKYQVTKVGKDIKIRQIRQSLIALEKTKERVNKFSKYYAWLALGLAFSAAFIWYICGKDKAFSMNIFVSILIIACPYAISLASKIAIIVGVKKGVEHGVLIKNTAVVKCINFNKWKNSQMVVVDKTGTLTEGQLVVKDIHRLVHISEDKLLQIAASVEKKANHLAGEAIVNLAEQKQIELFDLDYFAVATGYGIEAEIDSSRILLGNEEYIKKQGIVEKEAMEIAHEYELDGETPVFLAVDGQIVGIISVADIVRKESVQMVEQLKRMGFQVVIISGDNEKITKIVAEETGIESIYAECTMKEKELKVLMAQNETTVMVGNGINDVQAFAMADIGIAICSSEESVLNTADIILMNHDLMNVVTAIQLCKSIYFTQKKNLFWVWTYHIIGILVAAGILYLFGGTLLTPKIAWIIMSLSVISVVLGGLELKRFKAADYKE